jgi:hypothetical protein
MTSRASNDAAVVISTAAVRRVVLWLIALAVLAAAVYVGRGLFSRAPAAADQIDHGAYQAVFLTTGQAFYGKLTIPDAETYLLSDVFYIVPNDTAQRLVKRGTEVFGPREPMVIQARQVLFFENIRDDSDVGIGIRALKLGGSNPAAPLTTAVPLPTATGTARPSASR